MRSPSASYMDLPDADIYDREGETSTLSPQVPAFNSPITGIPAKARMRMDAPHQTTSGVSTDILPMYADNALQSSIASYNWTTCPWIPLQSSLMSNLSCLIHKFSSSIQQMGDRVQYMEGKI